MEHPFFTTANTRAEALRWLTISEKLLSARDLMGSRSFAMRARDSDPTLSPADEILAVVDTLITGDRRIGNNNNSHPDWYAILRLTPQQGRDSDTIATQYRNLVLLLNPQKNKFPFADQAFRLVVDAWSVLSNPTRKSMYDKEIAFYLQQQHHHQPDPFGEPVPELQQQNFIFFGGGGGGAQGSVGQPQVGVFGQGQQVPSNFVSFVSGGGGNFMFGSGSKSVHEPMSAASGSSYSPFGGAGGNSVASGVAGEQVRSDKQKLPQDQSYASVSGKGSENVNVSENVGERSGVEEGNVDRVDGGGEKGGELGNDSFWTACPYCFYVYEYPKVYVDCTLRCQNCKRAFQAVVIPTPPPSVEGQDGYFCCWGFMPLGFSMENWEKNRRAASTWTPFSPMFTCPKMGSGVKGKVGKRKSSAPRVYIDDDEVFVEISGSSESDEDWRGDKEKKRQNKAKNVRGKGPSGTSNRISGKNVNVDKGKNVNVENPNKATGEASKTGATTSGRKQLGRVAKNYGKLDLNVEFTNEADQAPASSRTNQGNGPGRGEDDYIEGTGFFEGLDELFSSLPILNVVGDDKVVKAS